MKKRHSVTLIFLLIYVLSFTQVYRDFKRYYSPGGQWEHSKPDGFSIFFTVTPVFNTVFAICDLAVDSSIDIDYRKFYGIKK